MIKKIIATGIFAGLLEVIINFQQNHTILILAYVFLFLLGTVASFKLKVFHKIGILGQLNLSALPIAYIASCSVSLIFIPALYSLQHIFVCIASIIFLIALSLISNVSADIENRKSLNSSDFLITISAFLIYSSIFGLFLFLTWPAWLFMILLIITTFILTYEFFWYNQLFEKHIVYSLMLTLIVSEIGVSLTFWPTGFLSRSAVVFTFFYVFTTLSKDKFKKILNKKVIANMIILGIIVILLALLTTKWMF